MKELNKKFRKINETSNKLKVARTMYRSILLEYIDLKDPKTSLNIQKLYNLLKNKESKGLAIQFALEEGLMYDVNQKLVKTVEYGIAEDFRAIHNVFETQTLPILIGSDLHNFICPENKLPYSPNEALDLFANRDRNDWDKVLVNFLDLISKFMTKLENDLDSLEKDIHVQLQNTISSIKDENDLLIDPPQPIVSLDLNSLKEVE